MAYKTPGVYIKEISTFPPSVVAVETATPAFIGYTEKAEDEDGKDLSFVPTRIKSLLELEERFGGDFTPTSYDVVLDIPRDNEVGSVSPKDADDEVRRYYLYGCVRHFYANGGGPCYIVSVGSYTDDPIEGDTTTPAGLLGGLLQVRRYDEPTLLVFPDGVSLSSDALLGSVQVAARGQCRDLQDRFVIMDLREGHLAAPSTGNGPVDNFRDGVGMNDLKYGAAYYPWLRTIYRPEVHFRQLSFFDIASAPIPNEATGSPLDELTGDTDIDALAPALRNADLHAARVVTAVDIGAMAGTDPLVLDRDNFADLPQHFADLLALLRETDDTAESEPAVRERFGNLVLLPRAIALAFQDLAAETTLPTELSQAVDALSEDTGLIDAIVALIALEKNVDVMNAVDATRDVDAVNTDYSDLNLTDWIGSTTTTPVTAADILADGEEFGTGLRAIALSAASALQQPFDKLAAAVLSVFEVAEFLSKEAEKQLFTQHPVFRAVLEQVVRTMSLLPASGAVAGVYAATDRTRGVWKAPANVSLADVIAPAVKINDQDQAGLNVHSTGKSVNAIRSFAGKGTLIWGARTLAGNDNEWRYVPVRRFFNMAEESIKKATEPFTFEPNDANTWVRVRAMIENFLTLQWRAGALAGADPAQAFFVKVGLGETMTAQDILEGRMIVEVGMAVVRPAEFIILKFAHKMQVS